MIPTCDCGTFPGARAEIPPRVLVVDDEPLVCWSLTTALRLAGFDAHSAADAAEARTLARQTPLPDVVLLDVRLWDTDRRQLLAEIREPSPHCRFLILAVAGQGECERRYAGATETRPLRSTTTSSIGPLRAPVDTIGAQSRSISPKSLPGPGMFADARPIPHVVGRPLNDLWTLSAASSCRHGPVRMASNARDR